MTPRAYQAALRLSVAPSATPAERANAQARCREYEATRTEVQLNSLADVVEGMVNASKAEHDAIIRACRRVDGSLKVPWWRLKVAPRTGPRVGRWMGNTAEFRQALRSEKHGHCAISEHVWSNYTGDAETLSILDSGRVDWTYFPEDERPGKRWKPSAEMKREMKEARP